MSIIELVFSPTPQADIYLQHIDLVEYWYNTYIVFNTDDNSPVIKNNTYNNFHLNIFSWYDSDDPYNQFLNFLIDLSKEVRFKSIYISCIELREALLRWLKIHRSCTCYSYRIDNDENSICDCGMYSVWLDKFSDTIKIKIK